jgi:CheY-like chemotaxis protein
MKTGASQSTLTPPHILLVDDNRLGLVARKTVLEEQGYRVTTAPDGQVALELFSRGAFDLLITDFKMPRMNGAELIKRVRVLRPEAPIILISGYAEALGLTESSTGADAVIAKSANEVSHLVRCAHRLLRRAAPRKPAASHRAHARVKRQGAS